MAGAGPAEDAWRHSDRPSSRARPRKRRRVLVTRTLRQVVAARSAVLSRLRELRRSRPRRAAFAGVFAVTFIAFLAVGTVLPVLPRYVKDELGAGDVAVGFVMGAFAFTAVIVRPLAGRMADTRARRPVFVAGLLVTALAGVLCLVPAGVPGLVVARLVLGAG